MGAKRGYPNQIDATTLYLVSDSRRLADFMRLLEPHLPAARRVAIEIVDDESTADDVVDSAVLRALTLRKELAPDSAVKPRFLAIVADECSRASQRESLSRRRLTRCSFCGKSQDQVRKLVAGPGVFICDQCVELCNEVLESHAPMKTP